MTKSKYPSILFAICVWSFLILRFGYRFGTGDQVELLPYALYLHDHSLYAADFFMQGLNASVPNERTVMAYLLLPFINHLELFCFVFQFLAIVVLVMGLEKLATRFIHNKYLAWAAVVIAIIPLNNFTLGDVDLYSDCLQASNVAVAIVVWAINLFLDRRFLRCAALMSVATFIHLLEGLDVMVMLCAIMLFMLIMRQITRKTFFAFISIYAFTAGIYLIIILLGKSAASVPSCKPPDSADLFRILFEFRHPHHYIFSSFPKLKMIAFFVLTILALVFFSEHSSKTFEFILIGLIGIIFYAFVVDDFHFIFIANFQFYRITVWMKFLGVVAAMGLAEEFWLSKINLPEVLKVEGWGLFLAACISWVVILKFNDYLPYHVPFQIFGLKEKDDMIDICEKIREVTPQNALFIQPFDNSELKYYARRSSFVEFKAYVHHMCSVDEWYRRIQLVYGLSVNDSEKGFALQGKADDYYYTHNLWKFNNHSGYGITHMLVRKEYKPPVGTLILSNNTYAVYKL